MAEEAAAAQQALGGTLERMRADLGASADLSAWARKYPWPTIGAAATVGFLAAVAIGSPPVRRRGEAVAAKPDAGTPESQARAAGQERGLLYSLLSELLRNLATAAQGALLGRDRIALFAPRQPGDFRRSDRSGPNHRRPERECSVGKFCLRGFSLGQRRRCLESVTPQTGPSSS